MWAAISDLGDAALTLPLAVVCFAWLTRSLHGWRIGVSWLTMLATTVWPMACLLIRHDGWRVRTRAALLPGLVLATAIGIARVLAEVHTVSEVIAGWMLGVLVTVLLLRKWKQAPVLPPWLRPVAAGSVLVVSGVAYGHHAPIQAAIETYSPFLCTRFG